MFTTLLFWLVKRGLRKNQRIGAGTLICVFLFWRVALWEIKVICFLMLLWEALRRRPEPCGSETITEQSVPSDRTLPEE